MELGQDRNEEQTKDLLIPPVLMYPKHHAQFWSAHLNKDKISNRVGRGNKAELVQPGRK